MVQLKKRNFSKILGRLNSALTNITQIATLGYINTSNDVYPFLKITLGHGNSTRALISAGIHGDEPAGVETICSFIETGRYKPHLNHWELVMLPCINPYGFEYNTRENQNKKDLNRLFKVESPPLEVQLAQSTIKQSYFDLSIELHEDYDSYGYYLFQKSNKPDGLELGLKIIESVKEIIPINLNERIDEMRAEKGIIRRIKNINEMKWWPMAAYSLAMKSGHCFTLESPTKLHLTKRVNAHLNALDKALINYPRLKYDQNINPKAVRY